MHFNLQLVKHYISMVARCVCVCVCISNDMVLTLQVAKHKCTLASSLSLSLFVREQFSSAFLAIFTDAGAARPFPIA